MRNKKLSIAIILPSIISKNGTAKQSIELATQLTKKGHKVVFYTYAYFQNTTFPEFSNMRVVSRVSEENSILKRFISNIAYLEIVYLYIAWFRINKFRELLTDKNIDIFNPNDWFSAWVVGGIPKARVVAIINDVPNRLSDKLFGKLKLKFDRLYLKNIEEVIVLDNGSRQKAADWMSLSKSKVNVVRSGLDVEKYRKFRKKIDLKKELHIDKKDLLIVCANLLASNRRYEDVLLAMKSIPRCHLLLLTKLSFNPSYARFLKKIIRENNLTSRVHIIDKFFTDKERMMYIQNSDVLVFPNSPQTWGLTVIEAMALGTPVIVSDGSGVSEVLKNNQNALIFKKKHIDELVKYIQGIKETNFRNRLAKAGRAYALNNFSWKKFSSEVEKIMMRNYV